MNKSKSLDNLSLLLKIHFHLGFRFCCPGLVLEFQLSEHFMLFTLFWNYFDQPHVMSKIKHSSKSHRCLFAFYRRIFLKLLLGLKERLNTFRSSRPEVFLRKGVLKIYSKFTGEHPYRSAISIKLLCNFIEIALRYGCSPVSLLHIFRKPFSRKPLGGCFCILTVLSLR